MTTKNVEILLASYNGAAFIREQLDSILAQTHDNWHLSVSDDGSSDDTVSIVSDYARRFPQKITLLGTDRRFGAPAPHFMALCAGADADIVALCDQDDVWFPDKLKKMTDLLFAQEQTLGSDMPILVFSDQTPTDAQLSPLSSSLMNLHQQHPEDATWHALCFQNVVTGGACLFNRALLRQALRCANPDDIVMHDWWLALTAARFGKLVYLNESTGYYRQHGGNAIGAADVRSVSYIVSRLRQLQRVRMLIDQKKAQAAVFQKTFGTALSPEEHEFLHAFTQKHSGACFYIKNRRIIHGFFRFAGMLLLG